MAFWIKRLLFRIEFALRYRTLKAVATDANDRVVACGHTSVLTLPKLCPHQGAPLIRSKVTRDYIVCSWHGCKYQRSDGRYVVAKHLAVS